VCGIVGIFQFDRQRPVVAEHIERMRDTMVHRGPDGGGLWMSPDVSVGLGHRRLSIIDLSNSASQPMTNEDGSIWVTYNGEIYNHVALRAELVQAGHRFRTDHSDTEIIVHGYEQWGIEGLARRIEGDYAIGLWDGPKRKLHLLRDRVGVKPLYFSMQKPGRVPFASEIKALVKDPEAYVDVDPVAMYHYLTFLTTPAPLTMFAGIYKLPAGFYLTFGDKGLEKAERYWDALPERNSADSAELARMSFDERENYYVEGVRSRLRAAVDKRMMSDVPFGVLLSGGIDSSTNVALMAELMNRPVRTFTVGFKDHTHLNELDEAKLVSRHFKTDHHEILIEERDMTGYLDQLIHSQDEPIADWVCIPLYFVSKLVRDSGTTVVQVGEGSDEQFCGYASYMEYLRLHREYWTPFKKLPGFAQKSIAGAAKMVANMRPSLDMYADVIDRAARDRHHFWSGATVFWNTSKRRLVNADRIGARSVPRELAESGLLPPEYLQPDTFNVVKDFRSRLLRTHPNADVLERMVYNEFKLRLPELLLMRVDKIGMSTSIEARVPFLDHHLVEYTSSIPMEHKVRGNVAKHILKKAVRGWIPDAIIDRKKMGFGAPMSQWLRGEFGRRVESTLGSSRLMNDGLFNRDYVMRICREHREGRNDYSLYIWTLFNLVAWFDYWVDGARA
jgi:asparagine synthase (glutamine-hydrolysing)